MGYEEEKQRQLDLRYLRMARIWAENSYCVRRKVGALIAKRALEKNITDVVFDRGGYLYHGRVKELADGARENGLKF